MLPGDLLEAETGADACLRTTTRGQRASTIIYCLGCGMTGKDAQHCLAQGVSFHPGKPNQLRRMQRSQTKTRLRTKVLIEHAERQHSQIDTQHVGTKSKVTCTMIKRKILSVTRQGKTKGRVASIGRQILS